MADYISISQAAHTLPGNPHPASVWRWCRRGIKARNGNQVYLHHRRIGSKLYTTAEAIEQFFTTLTDADAEYFAPESTASPYPPARPRAASDRDRAIAQAEAELDAAGI